MLSYIPSWYEYRGNTSMTGKVHYLLQQVPIRVKNGAGENVKLFVLFH